MNRARLTSPSRQRAMILLAVLLIIVAACLIGTTVALRTTADSEAVRYRLHECRARAAAWSGVLAVMVELEAQRSTILGGGTPTITAALSLGQPDDSVVVEARVEGGEEGAVHPTAACANVNVTPASMLASAGVLDESSCRQIAARAADRPFASLCEALVAAGVDPAPKAPGDTPGWSVRAEERPAKDVADVHAIFTACSFDPEVCAGVGEAGLAGEPRLAWSDLVTSKDTARLERLVGPDAGAALAPLVAAGQAISTRADMIAALRRANLDAKRWGIVLDRVRFGADDFVTGRVDLSAAGAAVLTTVPGIGPAHAASIVRARERLGAEALRSLAWPVTESLLSADEFQLAVDHLTTRSAQYRVRVVGSVVPREQPGASRPVLLAAVEYEAIIDVSAERARVAYLRDATLEGVAAQVWGRRVPGGAAGPEGAATTISAPTLDGSDRRAQNVPQAFPPSRADDTGTAASPGSEAGRTQGRVGRWSPGPRSRGGG